MDKEGISIGVARELAHGNVFAKGILGMNIGDGSLACIRGFVICIIRDLG